MINNDDPFFVLPPRSCIARVNIVGYMHDSKKKIQMRITTAGTPRTPIVNPQSNAAKNAQQARMYRGLKNFMRPVETKRPIVNMASPTERRLEAIASEILVSTAVT